MGNLYKSYKYMVQRYKVYRHMAKGNENNKRHNTAKQQVGVWGFTWGVSEPEGRRVGQKGRTSNPATTTMKIK